MPVRLALTQLFRGRPDDADRTIEEALRVAVELGNPMTVGYVRASNALLATFEPERRDLNRAVTALDAVTSTMHIGYFAVVAGFSAAGETSTPVTSPAWPCSGTRPTGCARSSRCT